MPRKKSKIKTKIGPLIDKNGNLTMRNKEMADILSKQYAKVFREPISPDAQDFNAEANNRNDSYRK